MARACTITGSLEVMTSGTSSRSSRGGSPLGQPSRVRERLGRASQRRSEACCIWLRLAGARATDVQAELELALRPILVDGVAHVTERLGHVFHADPRLYL